MYNSYFGFSETPFAITPDPRFLYMSPRHKDALAHLQYGLYESNGFVLLTGEVGTGKTALCRYLLVNLPEGIDAALILNPRQTSLELVANICDELHIDYPKDTDSIKILIDLLNRKLLQGHAEGRRTVLIIDEAQNLTQEVLEQVRLLTNLETSKRKLLQILLIGQPELNEVLSRPELRQLTQRITARYHIPPLTKEETNAYIQHRIQVAGVERPLFSNSAIKKIHQLSHGIPRLINTICDRALLGAYALTKPLVNAKITSMAAKEVLPAQRHGTAISSQKLLLASLLLIIVVSIYGFQQPSALEFIHNLASSPVEAKINPATPPQQPEPTEEVDIGAAEPATPTPPSEPSIPDSQDALASTASGNHETSTGNDNPLDNLFEEESCKSEAAFTALFQLWDTQDSPTPGIAPCDAATTQGLSCLHNKGTWNSLRYYNRPAIVEMRDNNGQWRHLLLDGINQDTISLSCGDTKVEATISQADTYWMGEYLLLWKPPGERTQLLLGHRGQDVIQIKKQLTMLDSDEPIENFIFSSVFDDSFKQQVIAFQKKHALTPDGIAGKDTLILLNNLTSDSLIPRLDGNGSVRD